MKNRKNSNIIHKKYRRYRNDIWGSLAKKKRNNFIKKQQQELENMKNFILQEIKDINNFILETEIASNNLWDVVDLIDDLLDCLNITIKKSCADVYTTQINYVAKIYKEFSNNILLSYDHQVLRGNINEFLSSIEIIGYIAIFSSGEIKKNDLNIQVVKLISELTKYKSQLHERIKILDSYTKRNLEKLENYKKIVNLE